jgi:hypothetical protein
MTQDCFVVSTKANIPGHLQDRHPMRFPDTRISYRIDRDVALDADGRVQVPGSVEFRAVITPGVLSSVCEPNELWSRELSDAERFRTVYDPEIQRGEKDMKGGGKKPILNEANIQSMQEDIRRNTFECPELMWNLRFGQVLWVYVEDARDLLIYEGVATRPDTNHRHHAIVGTHKVYRKWVRETGDETYEQYNPKREYALAIYTDDFAGEAHKFFVLNSKGWKVPPSKAHFVASLTDEPHLHARLAKDLMRNCGVLGDRNVEISQSTLSKNSAKMVLFYSLMRGLQAAFPHVPSEDDDRASLLSYLVEFVAELSRVRPNEIALLSLDKRQKVREESIADQAISWIGYFHMASLLRQDPNWKRRLEVLGRPYTHPQGAYVGDLFARTNPLWQEKGILTPPDAKGKIKVISNRNAQAQMVSTLDSLVKIAAVPAAA